MNYDLTLPGRVVFGWGRRCETGTLGRTLGKNVFVVCGSRHLKNNGTLERIVNLFRAEGVGIIDTVMISREPTVQDVDDAVSSLRKQAGIEKPFVYALGGGAAMDLAKTVAGLAPQDSFETVCDYLEDVGRGYKIENAPLPLMMTPTTAGTGSEATKNAVIASYAPPFKKSLRDAGLVPKIVLVDPELTVSCPGKITAESGMDAITQLFESYVSVNTQPFTQALCEQGLVYGVKSITEAVKVPDSRKARENMAHAALLSGICLANAGLGMAHGIAPALGSLCGVSHGAACAYLLPITLKANAKVCENSYARLAGILLDHVEPRETNEERVARMIEMIENLCDRIGTARHLAELGVTKDKIPEIAALSFGSSMKLNPRKLTPQDVVSLLEN